MGELGGDRIRHRGPHRRQAAGQRTHHAAADFQIARVPVGAGTRIAGDDRPLRQTRRQFPHHTLRIDRIGRRHRSALQNLPPFRDILLDVLPPRTIFLLLQHRQQRPQGLAGIADQPHFHRITQAEHLRLQVDLHAARLAFFRQEFRIGKAGADHQQRVAIAHQVPAWLGAKQADRAGHPGQVVGQHRLAQQCFCHAGAQRFGNGDDFLGGMQGAGADQDGDFLAGIQHFGGAMQVRPMRHHTGRGVADAGMHRAMRARGIRVRGLLQVVRQHQGGDAMPAFGDTHRPVHHVPDLRRRAGLADEIACHVLEHAGQVNFLLIMPADRGPRLLAGDRQYRHVIHTCVIQPGDQMRCARTRRRHADADLTGEFCVRRGHEGGHFLMPRLDEFKLAVGPAQRADQSIDAVAGVAEDRMDAPLMKAVPEEIAHCLAHACLSDLLTIEDRQCDPPRR